MWAAEVVGREEIVQIKIMLMNIVFHEGQLIHLKQRIWNAHFQRQMINKNGWGSLYFILVRLIVSNQPIDLDLIEDMSSIVIFEYAVGDVYVVDSRYVDDSSHVWVWLVQHRVFKYVVRVIAAAATRIRKLVCVRSQFAVAVKWFFLETVGWSNWDYFILTVDMICEESEIIQKVRSQP